MLYFQSFLRYFLAGFSAAVAMYLRDHGFNADEADKLALAVSGGFSAVALIWWSWKKNSAIAAERERLRQNNGDPITYKNPPKKDNYNG